MNLTSEDYEKLYGIWETKRSAGVKLLLIFLSVFVFGVVLTVILVHSSRTYYYELPGYDKDAGTLNITTWNEGLCKVYVVTPSKEFVELKSGYCDSVSNLDMKNLLASGLFEKGKYMIYVKKVGENVGKVVEFWY